MIYLDYAATSLKRKDVLAEIFSNIEILDGNSSSMHSVGRLANKYLEDAREKIAKAINASAKNIIFTSGASEANNTVIKNFDNEDFEIITTNIEHKSILESLEIIKSNVIYLKANEIGFISLRDLKEKITEKTKLVSITYVNNEIGSIQNVQEIGDYLENKDIHFHVDAVQALAHIDIDVKKIKCNSLSLSGHKIGALNGFGVLFINRKIKSLIYGGNQENNRRAGTTNVLSAVSMAECIEKINTDKKEQEKILKIKEYFLLLLKEKGIPFEINGSLENSVNHILNLYFPFVKSDLLLTYLDINGICASSGSACMSGSLEPSYVIKNIYGENRAEYSVRFSFGFTNTNEEIKEAINIINKMYQRKKNE